MTGKPKRHNLSDWLALHELDPSLCRQILSAAAQQVRGAPTDHDEPASKENTLGPDLAWGKAADAMCAFFTTQRSMIEDTFDKTTKVLVTQGRKSRQAATLDNGPGIYPTVIYNYLGKASDTMVVAHEFAHALQIVASRGRFVAPIMREVCAFIGEIALLSHCLHTDLVQHSCLLRVWHNDNQKYFVSDGDVLDVALHELGKTYEYCWNYPIARHISIEMAKRCSQEQIWMLFEGGVSVRQALQEFGR